MIRYLKPDEILFLHFQLIEATGGSHGVLNLGSLESAIHRPKAKFGGKELIPDLYDKAAALMESLVMNPPFVDGNKRIGIAAASLFLKRNGRRVVCTQDEMISMTLQVAKGKLKAPRISEWFRKHSTQS